MHNKGKGAFFWKQIAAYRYTVTLTPHHASAPKSFTVSLAALVFVVGLWSVVSIGGFVAFTQSATFLARWAHAELYKGRVQALAQQLAKMEKTYQGLVYLSEDMKYLLSLGEVKDWQSHLLKQEAAGFERDTIGDLLMGKISQNTLAAITRQQQEFQANAAGLMNQVSAVLLEQRNQAQWGQALPIAWPSIGHITSTFGIRLSPFHRLYGIGMKKMHHGIDIANSRGTVVRASAGGVVRRAGWMGGYGRAVVIDHGYGYSTLYGHMASIVASPGDYVQRGDVIAYMGSTGQSTNDHLHFEVWQHGRPVDPLQFVKLADLADLQNQYALNNGKAGSGGAEIYFANQDLGQGGAEE